MLTKIVSLEKLGGFRRRVRFNDGSGGIHDFRAMANEPGPTLAPLRDEASENRQCRRSVLATWRTKR